MKKEKKNKGLGSESGVACLHPDVGKGDAE